MIKNLRLFSFASILCVSSIVNAGALSLVQLQNLTSEQSLASIEAQSKIDMKKSDEDVNESSLRMSAMRDAAFAVGTQHGFVSHISSLKKQIKHSSIELDRIFDFNAVMKLSSVGDTELYMLPPIIQEAKDVVAISENEQKLRISGKIYSILKSAKLVGLPPNWRTYLLHDQDVDLQMPSKLLYPSASEEKILWGKWVSEGWVAGINQAEYEMTYRVRRLGKEYNGMVKYMSLLAQGKVKEPVVVSSKEMVTGGGQEMRVEDLVYQVSLPASLDSNLDNWDALILDPRGDLMAPQEKR